MGSVTDELLFVAVGRTVAALDRGTGKTRWQLKLPRMFGGYITLVVGEREVFAGRGGYVYGIDPLKGTVLWERGVNSRGSLMMLALAGGSSVQSHSAQAQAQMQQQAAMTAAVAASAAANG